MQGVEHRAAEGAEGTEAAAGSEDGKGTTAPLEIILRGRAVRQTDTALGGSLCDLFILRALWLLHIGTEFPYLSYKGSGQVLRDVWAPRRLGAQEPLRVGCPRVCIELMYQSSGYRTRFDIKQALTSINQPPPGS